MIHKRMLGRLGNQMFQYATIRAYIERSGDHDLSLDFSSLGGATYKNDLADFNIAPYQETTTPPLTLKQKSLLIYQRLVTRHIFRKHHNDYTPASEELRQWQKQHADIFMKNGIYSLIRGYMPIKISKSKTKIFDGYFESPKYFNKIKPLLQQEFTPKHPIPKKNQKLYSAMANSESVCVSIRRGDWVENQEFHAIHFVCTPVYFERAIAEIKRRVKNPRFFVFSDDIDWVKHNMHFPKNTMYEDGTDPVWEKMRLMYSCKHFIISNSTFSWWTQYLSRNPDKVVIAPTRWKNTYNAPDIYEDSWILVSPDENC